MVLDHKCEVCDDRLVVTVCALPLIPYSAGYCLPCLHSGAIPLWAAVANTAMIGGMSNANSMWYEVVHDTLRHLNLTCEQFDALVSDQIERDIAMMQRDLAAQSREPVQESPAHDQEPPFH